MTKNTQDLLTQLTQLVRQCQEFATNMDSLLDEAVLHEICAEMTQCLEELQATIGHQQGSTGECG